MLLGAGLCSFEEQLGISHDDAQKVGEVVRDSPRQQSHCFHFLRLTELPFQTPTLCNIFSNHVELAAYAILSSDRRPAHPDKYEPSVLALPIHCYTLNV